MRTQNDALLTKLHFFGLQNNFFDKNAIFVHFHIRFLAENIEKVPKIHFVI